MSSADIRADTVARIVAGSTAAGSRVSSWRADPYGDAETLPAVRVYTPSDSSTAIVGRGALYFRSRLSLVVESAASGATDEAAVAAAESLGDAILGLLFSSSTWLGWFETVESVDRSWGVKSDGNRRIAVEQTTIRAEAVWQYVPDLTAGNAADLELVRHTLDFAQPDGTIEATADVDIPT